MNHLPDINDFSASVLLLFLVILLKILVTHFVSHQPMQYFRFYCQRLADKVNKSAATPSKQALAGALAGIVTLVPIVIMLWLFEAFIEVPWLWQGFLLYLALDSFGLGRDSQSIAQALVAGQTYYARQSLNPWVLRQTEQLSSLGLSKACIEMQLLRCISQCFTVSLYFLLAGPLAAISYRLLLEMHYSWNVKRVQFNHFGVALSQAVHLLQWLPGRMFVLVLLLGTIGQNFVLFWRLLRGQFFKNNNDLVINALALVLGVKLGGVAMYDDHKLRREVVNQLGRQPEPTDIIHASKRINHVLYFSAACLIFAVFITLMVSNRLFS